MTDETGHLVRKVAKLLEVLVLRVLEEEPTAPFTPTERRLIKTYANMITWAAREHFRLKPDIITTENWDYDKDAHAYSDEVIADLHERSGEAKKPLSAGERKKVQKKFSKAIKQGQIPDYSPIVNPRKDTPCVS